MQICSSTLSEGKDCIMELCEAVCDTQRCPTEEPGGQGQRAEVTNISGASPKEKCHMYLRLLELVILILYHTNLSSGVVSSLFLLALF